ncbi:hypothetical protein TNCV_4592541 [Trichonephila clavipes]|nr:hypothetical protein TNCV_4592541 [Trichonephila clavipes]
MQSPRLCQSPCVRSRPWPLRAYTGDFFFSQFLRHFPEGSVVGVESSKFVLPDLVLKGFDLPVYPVLNVVQHSLVARISRELPGFPGSVPLIMSCRISSET